MVVSPDNVSPRSGQPVQRHHPPGTGFSTPSCLVTWQSRRFRPWFRLIALVVIHAFLASDLAWAGGPGGLSALRVKAAQESEVASGLEKRLEKDALPAEASRPPVAKVADPSPALAVPGERPTLWSSRNPTARLPKITQPSSTGSAIQMPASATPLPPHRTNTVPVPAIPLIPESPPISPSPAKSPTSPLSFVAGMPPEAWVGAVLLSGAGLLWVSGVISPLGAVVLAVTATVGSLIWYEVRRRFLAERTQGSQKVGLEEVRPMGRTIGYLASWRKLLMGGLLWATTAFSNLPVVGQRATVEPLRPQAAITMATQAPRAPPPIQLAQALVSQSSAQSQRVTVQPLVQSKFSLEGAAGQLANAPYSKEMRPAKAARRGDRIHALIALRWNLQWAGYLKPWAGYGDLEKMPPRQFEQALSKEIKPAFQRYQADHQTQPKLSKTDREIQRILKTQKTPFKPFAIQKAPVSKPTEKPGVQPPAATAKEAPAKTVAPPAVAPGKAAPGKQPTTPAVSKAELQRFKEEQAKAQASLKTLHEKRQQIQGEVKTLEQQKQTLERQLQELRAEIAKAEAMAKAAKQPPKTAQEAERQAKKLQAEVKRLQAEQERQTKALADLEAKKQKAQGRLTTLSQERDRLNQALANLRQETRKTEQAAAQTRTDLEALNKQKAQAAQELKQIQEGQARFKAEIESLRHDRDALQKRMERLREESKQLQRQVEVLRKQAGPVSLRAWWDGLDPWAKLSVILLGVTGFGVSFGVGMYVQRRRMERRLAEVEGRLAEAHRQAAAAGAGPPPPPPEERGARPTITPGVAALPGPAQPAIEATPTVSPEAIAQLQQARDALSSEITQLQEERSRLAGDLVDLQQQVQEAQQTLQGIQQEAETQRQQATDTVEEQHGRLEELTREISELGTQRDDLRETLEGLKREQQQHQRELTELNRTRDEATRQLEDLTRRLTQAQQQLITAQSNLSSLDEQRLQAEETLRKTQPQLEAARLDRDRTTQERDRLQQGIGGLRTRREEAEQTLAQARAILADVEQQVGQQRALLARIQEQVATQPTIVSPTEEPVRRRTAAELETAISALQEQLARAREIEEEQGRIGQNREQLAELQGRLARSLEQVRGSIQREFDPTAMTVVDLETRHQRLDGMVRASGFSAEQQEMLLGELRQQLEQSRQERQRRDQEEGDRRTGETIASLQERIQTLTRGLDALTFPQGEARLAELERQAEDLLREVVHGPATVRMAVASQLERLHQSRKEAPQRSREEQERQEAERERLEAQRRRQDQSEVLQRQLEDLAGRFVNLRDAAHRSNFDQLSKEFDELVIPQDLMGEAYEFLQKVRGARDDAEQRITQAEQTAAAVAPPAVAEAPLVNLDTINSWVDPLRNPSTRPEDVARAAREIRDHPAEVWKIYPGQIVGDLSRWLWLWDSDRSLAGSVEEALLAIVRIGGVQALEKMRVAYQDARAHVERQRLVAILGTIGTAALPTLVQVGSREQDPALRQEIGNAVLQSGEPDMPAIRQMLAEPGKFQKEVQRDERFLGELTKGWTQLQRGKAISDLGARLLELTSELSDLAFPGDETRFTQLGTDLETLKVEIKKQSADIRKAVSDDLNDAQQAYQEARERAERVAGPPPLQRSLAGVPEAVWNQLMEQFQIERAEIERQLEASLQQSARVRKLVHVLDGLGSVQAWLMQNQGNDDPEVGQYQKVREVVPALIQDLEAASPRSPPPIPVGEHGEHQLSLSPGEPQDLLRGYFSGDCTNCSFAQPFTQYLPGHLLSPGFLNFRVVRTRDQAWVGNVYAVVAQGNDGKTILLIDAIQIPWEGVTQTDGLELPMPNPRFPVKNVEEALQIADDVVTALVVYAQEKGFQAVWLGFVSNFHPFVSHFHDKFSDEFVLSEGQDRQKIHATLTPIGVDPGVVNSFFEFLDPPRNSMRNRGFIEVWPIRPPPEREASPPPSPATDLQRTLTTLQGLSEAIQHAYDFPGPIPEGVARAAGEGGDFSVLKYASEASDVEQLKMRWVALIAALASSEDAASLQAVLQILKEPPVLSGQTAERINHALHKRHKRYSELKKQDRENGGWSASTERQANRILPESWSHLETFVLDEEWTELNILLWRQLFDRLEHGRSRGAIYELARSFFPHLVVERERIGERVNQQKELERFFENHWSSLSSAGKRVVVWVLLESGAEAKRALEGISKRQLFRKTDPTIRAAAQEAFKEAEDIYRRSPARWRNWTAGLEERREKGMAPRISLFSKILTTGFLAGLLGLGGMASRVSAQSAVPEEHLVRPKNEKVEKRQQIPESWRVPLPPVERKTVPSTSTQRPPATSKTPSTPSSRFSAPSQFFRPSDIQKGQPTQKVPPGFSGPTALSPEELRRQEEDRRREEQRMEEQRRAQEQQRLDNEKRWQAEAKRAEEQRQAEQAAEEAAKRRAEGWSNFGSTAWNVLWHIILYGVLPIGLIVFLVALVLEGMDVWKKNKERIVQFPRKTANEIQARGIAFEILAVTSGAVALATLVAYQMVSYGQVSQVPQPSTQELIHQLTNIFTTIRWEILAGLGVLSGGTLIRYLVKQRMGRKSSEEVATFIVLLSLALWPVTYYVTQKFESDTAPIRHAAVRELAKRGDAGVVPDLITALRDPDVGVRQEAVEALVNLRDVRAIPYLIGALDDSGIQVKAAWALDTLGISESTQDPGLVKKILEFRAIKYFKSGEDIASNDRSVTAFARIGEGSIPTLVEMLRGDNKTERLVAERALIQIGEKQGQKVVDAIDPLWLDKNSRSEIRSSVAGIMASLGVADTTPDPKFLRKMLEGDTSLRPPVVKGFVRLGETSVAQLVDMLKSDDSTLHEAAQEALGHIVRTRSPKAFQAISDLLSDKNPDVRYRATLILGSWKSEESTELLKRAVRDPGWVNKKAAHHVLTSRGVTTEEGRIIEFIKAKDEEALVYAGRKAVDILISALKSGDDSVDTKIRDFIARVLGRIGDRRAAVPIAEAYEHSQIEARVAFGAIVQLKNPRTAKALLKVYDDYDYKFGTPKFEKPSPAEMAGIISSFGQIDSSAFVDVLNTSGNERSRETAVRVLTHINKKDEKTGEALLKRLEDSSSGVREAVIEAIGVLKIKEAVAPLIEVLKGSKSSSDEEEVLGYEVDGVVGALAQIGQPAVEPLIEILEDKKAGRYARLALGRIGAPAVEPLVKRLGHWHPAACRAAIQALAEVGPPAVPVLVKRFGSDAWFVREGALEAILNMNDPNAAVGALLKALSHPDWNVRWRAAIAFAQIPDERAVEPLIGLLNDGEPKVRKAAATALGFLGKTRAIQPLIGRFGDPDPFVREAAFLSVGRILESNTERSELQISGDVTPLLQDPDWRVRAAVAYTLGRFKQAHVVRALAEARIDPHPFVRREIALALGHTRSDQAVEALGGLLGDADPLVQLSAAQALDAIRDELTSDQLLMRLLRGFSGNQAKEELEQQKPPRTIYRLVRALADTNGHNVAQAKDALKPLGEFGLVALVTALEDPDASIRAAAQEFLSQQGEYAVPVLVGGLKSNNPFARQAAADALIKIGQPAIPVLEKAAWDERDPETSGLAVAVLRKIDYLKSQQVHQNLHFRYVTWPVIRQEAGRGLPWFLLSITGLGILLGAAKLARDWWKEGRKNRKTSPIPRRAVPGRQPITIGSATLQEDDVVRFRVARDDEALLGPQQTHGLTQALIQLRAFGYADALRLVKEIRLVKGNDRMAHADVDRKEVVLDIAAMASQPLLLMEFEHELQHFLIRQLGSRAPPVVEEIVILQQELRRFAYFAPSEQNEILQVLRDDPHTDDQAFRQLLTTFQPGATPSEPTLDILGYMIRSYPPEILRGLSTRLVEAVAASQRNLTVDVVQEVTQLQEQAEELTQALGAYQAANFSLMETASGLEEKSVAKALENRLAEEMVRFHRTMAEAARTRRIGRDLREPYEFTLRDLRAWRSFIHRWKDPWRLARAIVRGASYVYGDQLQTEEDRAFFKEALAKVDLEPFLSSGEGGLKKANLDALLQPQRWGRWSPKTQPIERSQTRVRILVTELPVDRPRTTEFIPGPEVAEVVHLPRIVQELEKLTQAVALRDPVLLVGETGVGKTALIRHLAYLTQHNLRRFNLNAQTDKSEFIGGYQPDREGIFGWNPGILIQAMREGHWLLLDEINLAEPEVIERIRYLLEQPDGFLVVTEHGGELWLPEHLYHRRIDEIVASQGRLPTTELTRRAIHYLEGKRIYPIHPEFRLFATMNPVQYEGRKQLSPAFRNKFRLKWVQDFTKEELEQVLKSRYPNLPDGVVQRCVGFHWEMRTAGGPSGVLGRQLGRPVVYTLRHLLRTAARVEHRFLRAARSKKSVDPLLLAAQETSEVYGATLASRGDVSYLNQALTTWFGLEPPKPPVDMVVDKAHGALHVGEVVLPINPAKEVPDVPGPDAELLHVPTTLQGLRQLARAIEMKEKPLLVGPTGASKTAWIRYLAGLTRNSYKRISLDGQTEAADLIGKHVPVEGTTGFQWQPGSLVEAMEKGYWVLLDELNLAHPDVLERINSLLDDDAYLVVTEHEGEVIRPHPNFRLFAAMNPEGYAGRNLLSLAMRNKFSETWVSGEMPMEEIQQVTAFYLTNPMVMKEPPLPADLAESAAVEMAKSHQKVAQLIAEGKLGRARLGAADLEGYHFSLRDLKDWAQFIRRMAPPLGLSRAVLEGAAYIYRDRLEGQTEKELLLKEVIASIDQLLLGELVDLKAWDFLEEEGKGAPDWHREAVAQGRILDPKRLVTARLVDAFDQNTAGLGRQLQRDPNGLPAIRRLLLDPEKIPDGVRGFALLPPELAKPLVEIALRSSEPKLQQAAIEVIGHLKLTAFNEDLIQLLDSEDPNLRATAAIVLEHIGFTFKQEAIPRIAKRPIQLPFRKTIAKLMRDETQAGGDYLGFWRFLAHPMTVSAAILFGLATSAFATPLLVGGMGLGSAASFLAYLGVAMGSVAGLGGLLAGLIWATYSVVYFPQYKLLLERYRSLPLNLNDFFQLMEYSKERPSIRLPFKPETPAPLIGNTLALAFLGVSSLSGASWAVELLRVARADSLPVLPVWMGWPPLLKGAGILAGISIGFVASAIMAVGTVSLREMLYKPLRALWVTHRESLGWEHFKITLPHSQKTLDLFDEARRQRLAEEARRLRTQEGPGPQIQAKELRSELRPDHIRQTEEGVLIDDVLIPYASEVSSSVPSPEAAQLVPTVGMVRNLKKIALSALLDDPVLLIGETGVGKTSLVRHLAYLTRHGFQRFNLSGQTEKTEFIGGYKPDEKGLFGWVPGILIKAMDRGEWLVLDEINLAEPQVVERLNSLLDDDRQLRIQEHGGELWVTAAEYNRRLAQYAEEEEAGGFDPEAAVRAASERLGREGVHRIHPDFRLFATMNPADYAGRQLMSPAMLNRFRVKWIDEMFSYEQQAILEQLFQNSSGEPFFDPRMLDELWWVHDKIRGLAASRTIGRLERDPYHYTLRDLLRVTAHAAKEIRRREGAEPLPGYERRAILGQAVVDIYSERIRDEIDRGAVEMVIRLQFRDPPEQPPLILKEDVPILGNGQFHAGLEEQTRGVAIGEVLLPYWTRGGPFIPGFFARMTLVPSTLRHLRQLAQSVRDNEPVLLVGPTGSAKTSLVRYMAYLTRNNFVRMNLDGQTSTSELIGQFIPKEEAVGEFEWQDGLLIEAMKNGYWILLDEFNLADPEILERINSLLDDDRSLVITEHEHERLIPASQYDQRVMEYVKAESSKGRQDSQALIREAKRWLTNEKIFRIDPNFRLFAAMNPERYSGRNRLSLAMRNKFREIWIGGVTDERELTQIVQDYLSQYAPTLAAPERQSAARTMARFHRVVEAVSGDLKGGGFERYQFSVRELRAWARYLGRYGAGQSLHRALAKGAVYLYFDRLTQPQDQKHLLQWLREGKAGQLNAEIQGILDERVRGVQHRLEQPGPEVRLLSTSLPIVSGSRQPYAPSLESARLIPTEVTVRNLDKVAQAIQLNEPLLLVGETGVGKTSLIRYLAALTNHPYRRFNLSGQTEKGEFIGRYQPDEHGHFQWHPGVLIQAMEHGYWLVLDEINLAAPQVVERINSLLDDDGFLFISERKGEQWVPADRYQVSVSATARHLLARGEAKDQTEAEAKARQRIRIIHPDFRLFATMNPAEYAGRQVFSPALLNRFRVKWIDELPEEDLRQILLELHGQRLPSKLVDAALRLHGAMQKEARETTRHQLAYTTRHLLRWMDRVATSTVRREGELAHMARQEAVEVYGDGLGESAEHQRLRNVLQHALEAEAYFKGEGDERAVTIREEPAAVSFDEIKLAKPLTRTQSVPGPRLHLEESDRARLKKLAKAVSRREPILMIGPTGGGKTSLARELSTLANHDFVALDLDGQSDVAQLLGYFKPVEGKQQEYAWEDGQLVKALKNGWWILIDELNLAQPEILERLNSLLDEDGFLVLTEHQGEVITPQEGFHLFAAMNPQTYAGRNLLSLAMLSKFHTLWVPEARSEDEQVAIVVEYLRQGQVSRAGLEEPRLPGGEATHTPEENLPHPSPGPLRQIRNRLKAWEIGRRMRSIEAVAKSFGGDFQIRLQPGQGWAINFPVQPEKPAVVTYPQEDLDQKSIHYVVGAAMHEGGHRDISWFHPFFLESESKRFLFNAVEDPRVNNWIRRKYEGSTPYLRALYRDAFKEQMKEGKSFDELGVLPHIQYGFGLIYRWWSGGQDHPAIKNPKVLEALGATFPDAVRSFETLAGYVTVRRLPGERMVLESSDYGRKIIDLPRVGSRTLPLGRSDVSGVYRKDEDTLILTTGRRHEEVQLPLKEGQTARLLVSLWPSVAEKQQAAQAVAEIIRDRIWPVYQQLIEESVNQAMQGMGAGAGAQGRSSGAGGSAQARRAEAERAVEAQSKEAADGLNPQLPVEGQQLRGGSGATGQPLPPPSQLPAQGSGQGQPTPLQPQPQQGQQPQGGKPGEQQAGRQPAPGQKESGQEPGESQPSQASQQGSSQAFGGARQPAQTQPSQPQGQQRVLGEPGSGAPPGPSVPQEEYPAEGARMSEMDRLRYERQTRELLEPLETDYDEYRQPVQRLIDQLASLLDNELHKDTKLRHRGDYETGSKVNLRKAMSMRETGDTDIWLRRVMPTKRSFKFAIVVDESGSMGGSKTINAIHGLILLAEVLGRLDIEFTIIGFSDGPSLHKPLHRPFKHENKEQLLGEIRAYFSRGGSTADGDAVAMAIEELKHETSESRIIIVITDGMGNTGAKTLNEVLADAKRQRMDVIGIGVGPGMEWVNRVYPTPILVSHVEQLPDILARVLVDVIVHHRPTIGPGAIGEVKLASTGLEEMWTRSAAWRTYIVGTILQRIHAWTAGPTSKFPGWLFPHEAVTIFANQKVQAPLTIEIDANTLIDTGTGKAQLRGLGFAETAAGLKVRMPSLILRLVNVDPLLRAGDIHRILRLPPGVIEVVDQSGVALSKSPQTVNSSLPAGSFAIVVEGHERYWDGRVDILVKRPRDGQLVDGTGLLVAALSRMTNSTAWPQSMKSYLQEVTISQRSINGNPQPFLPLDEALFGADYVFELRATNRRLRQMV